MRKGPWWEFLSDFFVGVILSLSARCGRGRGCFVVVGKIGALISDRFRWIVGDISSMPRRNATGVVCIFLIWGIDDVYIVLWEVCSNTCDFRKSYSTARREKRYIHRHTHF